MATTSLVNKIDLSIVLCGEAGQGIQTIENALAQILRKAGFYIFATKEYMSRVRGGTNSTSIRISNQPVSAYISRIDVLVALSTNAVTHLTKRISDHTLIVGGEKSIDFNKIAVDVGNKIYVSAVAIGFVLGLLKIDAKLYENFFKEHFNKDLAEIVNVNIQAAKSGYNEAKKFLETNSLINEIIPSSEDLTKKTLLNGAQAVALGAVAGGCNFISSYPMSPSTGILNQLASCSQEFDIIVEQAEDEICAINMGLGAWYAGARAVVTTSGGGFALMCEGLSLAGMTETPIVINLAQRPAPATGLPTRTEQADLNLALYAGHGEFPRIIFAPGTLEQAFNLSCKAFDLADKYQLPVIILSDQYLVDSYYIIDPIHSADNFEQKTTIIRTSADYKRYQLTENGISPRGIPGFGEGIVCVDSDEHTEEGYITEDFDLRVKMVDKRLKKLSMLVDEVVKPELIGKNSYDTLIVCWGSNYHQVKEVLDIINRDNIAMLHFSQVYPLNIAVTDYFKQAKKIIVIENNATAQFKNLLQQELHVNCDENILKYNGLPFAVEELVEEISRRAK
jgi:2-oxoglutarate ferredoxin oxidoreductase subunit alpha